MMPRRPAWSSQFTSDQLQTLQHIGPLDRVTWEEAFGGSSGKGVKVAIIDSGVDATHPALEGAVKGYVAFEKRAQEIIISEEAHTDESGHGTACAGIIHAIVPDCEIYSVKVLGKAAFGQGVIFVEGLRWAITHGMHVCNLSLGTTKKEFFTPLHELADLAYFRQIALVTAANNFPIPSFPSMYASVISVAAHEGHDPWQFYYNPSPPVEFGAPGINVRVPWHNHQWISVTGNSFAAPHITALVAMLLGKHAGLTPFQVKTILRARAANATYAGQDVLAVLQRPETGYRAPEILREAPL